jgi:hypothetical protein
LKLCFATAEVGFFERDKEVEVRRKKKPGLYMSSKLRWQFGQRTPLFASWREAMLSRPHAWYVSSSLSVFRMTWHTSVSVDPQYQQTSGPSSFLMRSRVAIEKVVLATEAEMRYRYRTAGLPVSASASWLRVLLRFPRLEVGKRVGAAWIGFPTTFKRVENGGDGG